MLVRRRLWLRDGLANLPSSVPVFFGAMTSTAAAISICRRMTPGASLGGAEWDHPVRVDRGLAVFDDPESLTDQARGAVSALMPVPWRPLCRIR
jgi:hypothetical protein